MQSIPKNIFDVKNMEYIRKLSMKEKVELMIGFIVVYIIPIVVLIGSLIFIKKVVDWLFS